MATRAATSKWPQLYDATGTTRQAVLDNAFNVVVTEQVLDDGSTTNPANTSGGTGQLTLDFSLPFGDPKAGLIVNEMCISVNYPALTGGLARDVFAVRNVTTGTDSSGAKVCNIAAEGRWYDLGSADAIRVDPAVTTTSAALTAILVGSGWTIGTISPAVSGGPTRTFQIPLPCTPLAAVRSLPGVFGGELVFDTATKTVSLLAQRGSSTASALYAAGNNVSSDNRVIDTTALITRLYPLGASGVDITTVNSGVGYLENYSWYDAQLPSWAHVVKAGTSTNDTLSDPTLLKAWGVAQLAMLALPRVTYAVAPVMLTSDGVPGLGDVVRVWDKSIALTTNARVVQRTLNLLEPALSTLQINTSAFTLSSALPTGTPRGTVTPVASLDHLAPAAPTGIVVTGVDTLDGNGNHVDYLTIAWNAVTTNSDGSPCVDLDHYNVAYRIGANPWISAGQTKQLTVQSGPMPPGVAFSAQVQAADTSGNLSAWTVFTGVTPGVPPSTLNPPSLPVLDVVTFPLTVRAAWDGLDSGGTPYPTNLDHLEVHVGLISGYTPTVSGSLVDTLRAPGVSPITGRTAGTTYYVRYIAVDTAGFRSAPSGEAQAVATSVQDGQIGSVSIGKLTAGLLTADLIVSARIATADTGARIELSPDGLLALDSAEDVQVSLPTDPALNPYFAGDIQAFGLTVTDHMKIRGTTNEFAPESVTTLAGNISAPPLAPTVTIDYPAVSMTNGWASLSPNYVGGGVYDSGNLYLPYLGWGDGSAYFVAVDSATGADVQYGTLGSNNLDTTAIWPSLTKIGGYFYLLSMRASTGGWDVHKFDATTLAYVSRPIANLALGTKRTALGNDGTNLLVSYCTTTQVVVNSYTPAGVLSFNHAANHTLNTGIVGVHSGSFDYGSPRVIVAPYTAQGSVYTYTTSGTLLTNQPNESFANGCGSAGTIGNYFATLMYDGANFRGLSKYSNDIRTFTGIKWTTESSQWWASYVWHQKRQSIDLGAATAGTVAITFAGQTTTALARTADAPTVQAAFEALSNITPGDVAVTGGPWPAVLYVAWAGAYDDTDPAAITAVGTGLTGGTITISAPSYSTTQSKRANFTMTKRRRLTLTAPAYPVISNAATATVDSATHYIGRGATDPGRTAMWNSMGSSGSRTQRYLTALFSGANPLAAGTFPLIAPGVLVSSAVRAVGGVTPVWTLSGDGTFSHEGFGQYSSQNGQRTVTDGVLNSTTTITSATAIFSPGDVGRTVVGTSIPATAVIATYVSPTSVTISSAATATASGRTLAIGLPILAVGNSAGTVMQTLTIPACTVARMLAVSMCTFMTSTGTDNWETLGTWDSNAVAVNPIGRFRLGFGGSGAMGSGTIYGLVAQPAGTVKTLRVWLRQITGSGVATGTTDGTFVNIQATAYPS